MPAVDTLKGALRDWRTVAGIAVLYAWTWLLYWGGPLSFAPLGFAAANARWTAFCVANALATVSMVVALPRACVRPRPYRGIDALAAASGLAGTLASLALVAGLGSASPAAFAAGCAAGLPTGWSQGCLLCRWCARAAAKGTRAALAGNMLALGASGALFLAVCALPFPVSSFIALACPVGSAALLALAPAGAPDPVDAPAGAHPHAPTGTSNPARTPSPGRLLRDDASFARLCAVTLLFSVSNGFIDASFNLVEPELYGSVFFGVVLGTIGAALLAFAATFLFKLQAWQLVFQMAVPLMVLAYLLLPHEQTAAAGQGVHALGYQYFFVTLWPLLGSRQVRGSAPAELTVPFGLSAAALGNLAGLLLWNALISRPEPVALGVVSGTAVMGLVLMAVLFQRPAYGWETVRWGAQPLPRETDFEQVAARVGQRYGLSARETQVCALLGRGRNRQFIADELSISLETARSHVASVYRKLRVYSQQELLDVFEQERSATGDVLPQSLI